MQLVSRSSQIKKYKAQKPYYHTKKNPTNNQATATHIKHNRLNCIHITYKQ